MPTMEEELEMLREERAETLQAQKQANDLKDEYEILLAEVEQQKAAIVEERILLAQGKGEEQSVQLLRDLEASRKSVGRLAGRERELSTQLAAARMSCANHKRAEEALASEVGLLKMTGDEESVVVALKRKIVDLQRDLKLSREQASRAWEAVKTRDHRISTLETQNASLAGQLSQSHQKAEDEMEQMRAAATGLRDEITQARMSIAHCPNAELDELRAKLAEAEEKSTHISNQAEAEIARLQEKVAQAETLEKLLHAARQSCVRRDRMVQEKAEELSTVKEKLTAAEAKGDRGQMERHLAELEEDLTNLKETLEEKEDSIALLRTRAAQAESEARSLFAADERAAELEMALDSARLSVARHKTKAQEDLEEKVKIINDLVEQLEQEKVHFSKEREALEAERDLLANELAQLKTAPHKEEIQEAQEVKDEEVKEVKEVAEEAKEEIKEEAKEEIKEEAEEVKEEAKEEVKEVAEEAKEEIKEEAKEEVKEEEKVVEVQMEETQATSESLPEDEDEDVDEDEDSEDEESSDRASEDAAEEEEQNFTEFMSYFYSLREAGPQEQIISLRDQLAKMRMSRGRHVEITELQEQQIQMLLEEVEDRADQHEVDKLRQELQQARLSCNRHRAVEEEQSEQIKKLQHQLQAVTEQAAAELDDVRKAAHGVESLKEELRKARFSCGRHQENETLREVEVGVLQLQLSAAEEASEALKQKMEKTQQEYTLLTAEMAELRKEADKAQGLKKDVRGLKRLVSQSEKERKALEKARAAVEKEKKEETDRLCQKVAHLEATAEAADTKIREMEEEIRAKEEAIEKERALLAKSKKSTKDPEKQKAEVAALKKKLEMQKQENEVEARRLQQEVEAAKRELDAMAAQSSLELECLRKELAREKEANEKLRRRMDSERNRRAGALLCASKPLRESMETQSPSPRVPPIDANPREVVTPVLPAMELESFDVPEVCDVPARKPRTKTVKKVTRKVTKPVDDDDEETVPAPKPKRSRRLSLRV